MADEVPDEPTFLSEPDVAVLAVEHPGHAPVTVPVWYSYRPGGDLWLLTERDSFKARLLRAAGRATVVVDTVVPRTRWVSVSCELVDERPGTDDDRRAMASRYLPPPQVEEYLAFAAAQIDDEVVLVLRPGRWRGADLTPG